MTSNETSQPMAERRDEISPVDSTMAVDRENIPAPATSSHPRGSTNESAPLPMGDSTVQPPSAARQQPAQQPYPQQQLPYTPYPYPPQPYAYPQPLRLVPQYSKPWMTSKLILATLLIIVAVVILALACVFVSTNGDAQWTAAYALPITIASILWNGAELITFAVRTRKNVKRGIHPGAHVGLHLCFWIVCVFAVLLAIVECISIASSVRECAEEANSRYSYYSYCDDYGDDNASYMNGTYLPMLRAVAALFCVMTLAHFVLFVFACIDTHKRNMLKPAGMVVPPQGSMYYPPPPPPAGASYYPYPIPMAPGQAHFATSPNAPGVTEQKTMNPAVQNYQNLAGFYAPAPRSPTRSMSNEKAVPSSSAQPGQAL
ncbi:hypothetical protein F4804DRAFT_329717 [Jackrogersella minutella]|nr:hypothetical protein F4804DRAFT_329717 [Jackrogersella minutella]